MTREHIYEAIVQMITGHMNLPIDPQAIEEELPLGEAGLALDSIQIIELAARIEAQLGVKLSDSELLDVGGYTVGELLTTLQARANAV
ncbi:acyl carrier protein [Paenibacillus sp. SYP-B4298]|uniref:acyl carrier protein n=1 Tax=Paenibacillus sp. SYP-B4298 TaxID=2996034 RepID=UPI0022DE6B61|nr:phosphopantetheine-binding protein [Paenibacillus sp. SYP-B4298]